MLPNTTLDETLALLRENWMNEVGNPFRDYCIVDHRPADGSSSKHYDGWTRTQLRFDFEGESEEMPPEEVILRALGWMKIELEDLIQDGDMIGKGNDALLKAMDGAKKRGRQPNAVCVPSGSIYQEYRPARNQFEYTVYCVLYVDWRENVGQDRSREQAEITQ